MNSDQNKKIDDLMILAQSSKEKGDILFSELSYGQRMVTKEGDLWRWDGLVVSAGAPGSAAERLGHRNHLIEIYDSIKNFEKNNGNMEHLRDQLKIEHKNLSDLKLNFEKYQLDKKNISEIEKRSDLAKDQISILKERIKKFEEENNDLDQKPEDVELRKTELNEKISSAKKNSNEDNDNLANIENRLRDLVNEIRTLSDKESLLREKKGLNVGRLDSRYLGLDKKIAGSSPDSSIELDSWNHSFTPAINYYLRNELGFKTDLRYNVFGDVHPWDRSNDNTRENLRMAMAQNPFLKVFIQSGYYDGATNYFQAKYTMWQIDPSGRMKDRFYYEAYRSGHMMYLRKEDLEKSNDDLREFIESSLTNGVPAKY